MQYTPELGSPRFHINSRFAIQGSEYVALCNRAFGETMATNFIEMTRTWVDSQPIRNITHMSWATTRLLSQFLGRFRRHCLPRRMASISIEQTVHEGAMRLGRAPACEDVPCTTCEMYLGMRERSGSWNTAHRGAGAGRPLRVRSRARKLNGRPCHRGLSPGARDKHHAAPLPPAVGVDRARTWRPGRGDRSAAPCRRLAPRDSEASRRLAEARGK
jgi:hypothetical protein